MHSERLGQILVGRGLLRPEQLETLLRRRRYDPRPLWQLAVEVAGIEAADLWDACANELLPRCPLVNLVRERVDPDHLTLLRPNEAWENLVLPLRLEAGELVCATTEETLPAAISLLQARRGDEPWRLVISEIRLLEQFIAEAYGYEGVELSDNL